jgi:hypothetical protein
MRPCVKRPATESEKARNRPTGLARKMALDLYVDAGGATRGLQQAGFHIVDAFGKLEI